MPTPSAQQRAAATAGPPLVVKAPSDLRNMSKLGSAGTPKANAAPTRGRTTAKPKADTPEQAKSKARSASRSPSPSRVTKERTDILLEKTKEALANGSYIERALRHGACTDSWHDFHGEGGYNETDKPIQNSYGLYDTKVGIPGGAEVVIPKSMSLSDNPDSLHDENEIMQEMFSTLNIAGFQIAQESHPKYFMDTLIRKLAENLEENERPVHPTFTSTTIDGSGGNYSVKLLSKRRAERDDNYGYALTNVPAMVADDRLDSDEIIQFFGSDRINLLFDASVVDVVGIIRNCDKGASGRILKVNRIVNREIINDPAPKTYEFKTAQRAGATGNNVEANIIFDDEKDQILYSSYEGGARELNRNKFFSNFNFSLGKLLYQKKGLPLIRLDISNTDGTLNYFDDNPHESNNINFCWERISKIHEKSTTKHIDAAVNFQCKRSGDWLQALSCLDTGRKFVRFADTKKRVNPEPYKLEGDKIILVTHDRVLLYYALLLGLDVIMTYKFPADQKARAELKAQEAAAAASSAKDDDEDDGSSDVPYVPHPGKSSKYIVYFCNEKRLAPGFVAAAPRIDPLIKVKEMLTKAKGLLASVDILSFIDRHNGFIDEILKENEAEIKLINAAFETEIMKPDNMARTLKLSEIVGSLIQSYFKISCSKYKGIDRANYENLKAEVSALNARSANLLAKEATIKEFISSHDNLAAKSVKLGTKVAIQETHGNYKKNENYKNLVLITLVKARWGGRSGVDKSSQTRLLEIGTFFIQNLAPKHLWNLIFDIENVVSKIGPMGEGAAALLNQLKALSPPAAINGLYNAGGLIIGPRKDAIEDRCIVDAAAMAAKKMALAAATKPKEIAAIQNEIAVLEGMPFSIDDEDATKAQQKVIAKKIEDVLPSIAAAVKEEVLILEEVKRRQIIFEEKASIVDYGIPDTSRLDALASMAAIEGEIIEANKIWEEEIGTPAYKRQLTAYLKVKKDEDLHAESEKEEFELNDMSYMFIKRAAKLMLFFDANAENVDGDENNDDENNDDENNDYENNDDEINDEESSNSDEDLADKWIDILRKAINHYKLADLNKFYRTAKFLYNAALSSEYDGRNVTNFDRIFEKRNILIEYGNRCLLAKKNKEGGDWKALEALMSAAAAAPQAATKVIDADLLVPVIPGGKGAPDLRPVLPAAAAAETTAVRGAVKRKEAYTFTTLGNTLKLVGSYIYNAFARLSVQNSERIEQRNGEEQTGGAIASPQISYLSVLLYLRQLVSDMSGFDDQEGNEDYKYYQSLCNLVLSVCKPYSLKERKDPYFYNKIQAALFNGIPNDDLMVDGSNDNYIISNRSHASVVQFIGRQVALQTFGQSTGEISDLGNSMVEIPEAVKDTYVEIKSTLNNMAYVDRKRYLINALQNRIRGYEAPQVAGPNMTRGISSALISKMVLNARTRETNKNRFRGNNHPTPQSNLRPMVSVESGGMRSKRKLTTRKLNYRKNKAVRKTKRNSKK